MTPEALTNCWDDLASEPPSSAGIQRRRLRTDAAADIFACIFWPSRKPGLLVEGNGEHRPGGDRIPTCRGVRIVHEVVTGTSSRTLLRVVLEDQRLRDIFAVMSADLVNIVAAEQTVAAALRRCIDRLCMWQGLFEKIPAEGLSEERQRGMLGELLVLETIVLARIDPFDGVQAWKGPDPANQDFILGGLALEVKTSLAKRHARIIIANEKQLDERPHDALIMAYLRLDESAAHGDSLSTIVARLRSKLVSDPAAAQCFEDRLASGGYLDVHAPLYQCNRWLCSATRFYRVEGNFPRLTEANLPVGVGDISYTVIADDLGPYEVTADDVAVLLDAANG